MGHRHGAGKAVRMRRIFSPASGRAVIVAADHGIMGRPQGLEWLEGTLRKLWPSRPDAVLLNPRMFERVSHLWTSKDDPAVILSLDAFVGGATPLTPGGGEEYALLSTPLEAAALGADAVKVMLVFGRRDTAGYRRNLECVARAVAQAGAVGLPCMVEAALWGEAVDPAAHQEPRLVADMARVATELGADMLKLPFAGGVAAFREIVGTCPVPVLILGGARVAGEEQVVQLVRTALEAGVAGLVFGRNIWQHPDAEALLRRIVALVHGHGAGGDRSR